MASPQHGLQNQHIFRHWHTQRALYLPLAKILGVALRGGAFLSRSLRELLRMLESLSLAWQPTPRQPSLPARVDRRSTPTNNLFRSHPNEDPRSGVRAQTFLDTPRYYLMLVFLRQAFAPLIPDTHAAAFGHIAKSSPKSSQQMAANPSCTTPPSGRSCCAKPEQSSTRQRRRLTRSPLLPRKGDHAHACQPHHFTACPATPRQWHMRGKLGFDASVPSLLTKFTGERSPARERQL